MLKVYLKWFRNHGSKKQETKPPLNMGRKWMDHWVIDSLWKQELLKKICDEMRVKPRSSEMMTHYFKYLSALVDSLSEEEIEKAIKTAEEWNWQGVSPKAQADVMKKKSESMIQHFVREMYKRAGMRVFVISAWKNDEGKVLVSG
ncbi:hypothetical protein F4604DRAFT_1921009 [Suillus subluteus]|nr:hypothetical protein F4604DRAFT_1921009 [Suillus subluteus]